MLAQEVAVVDQTTGLLVASMTSTSVRQWRARMTRDRTIDCCPAYVLHLKAGFAAPVAANVAIPAVAAAGDAGAKLPESAALLTDLLTWWLPSSVATPRGDA